MPVDRQPILPCKLKCLHTGCGEDVGMIGFVPQGRGLQQNSAWGRKGTSLLPPTPQAPWSHCHLISTETSWLPSSWWGWGDGSENSSSFQDPGWQGLWEAGLAQITPNTPSLPPLLPPPKDQGAGKRELAPPGPCLLPPQTIPGVKPSFPLLPHFLLSEGF